MSNFAPNPDRRSEQQESADDVWPEGRFVSAIQEDAGGGRKDVKWWERLSSRLAELNWSKADLSRRADVAYDSVNKYLRGSVDKPRGDILDKLSKAVGRDTRWLLFGDNTKHSFEDFIFKNEFRRRDGESSLMDPRVALDYKKNYPAVDNFTQSNFLAWDQLPRFSDFECGFERFASRRMALRRVLQDRYFTVPVPDDSMSPIFRRDEALVFEVAATCREDDYVIASLKSDDSVHLKRLHVDSSSHAVSLRSVLWPADAETERAREPRQETPFKIIGKLILHMPGVVLRPAEDVLV